MQLPLQLFSIGIMPIAGFFLIFGIFSFASFSFAKSSTALPFTDSSTISQMLFMLCVLIKLAFSSIFLAFFIRTFVRQPAITSLLPGNSAVILFISRRAVFSPLTVHMLIIMASDNFLSPVISKPALASTPAIISDSEKFVEQPWVWIYTFAIIQKNQR